MKNLLITITLLFSVVKSQVIINEYSASNLSRYLDNYDLEEDWIELYNSSMSDVDIGGYYLSDKQDNPLKWSIPGGTVISANDYLVFWCSGRDEASDGHFHTNFKLQQTRNEQEFVVLSTPYGETINEIELQKTQLNHSRGRSPNASNTWKIFTNPTLGESNFGSNYAAYAASPEMSLEAGFYSGTQILSISTDEPNSVINYTTNGNVPLPISSQYSEPLTISNTQIVKALVVSNDDDILPSFVTFNTYFIDENHTLPIISAAANQFTTMLNGNQYLRPHGTIEYFDSDGDREDYGYGEYNKHGQDSWAFPQRSFDYIARDEMGYHDAIREKLLSLSDRDVFQRIIVRASGDDNYPGIDSSAHMRDIFIQKMANKNNLNVDMRRGERCVVYANGNYWGIYSIREKVSDADYTNYYYGQDKYHTQYLMNWGGTWAQYGGQQAFDDWYEIHDFAMDNDLSIPENYQHVSDEIDVTSLVDYVLINSFVVCTDWINWNTSWWRGLNPDGTHLKWGYILWDEDATFNHYINYTNVPDESPQAPPCYPEGIYLDPEHHIDLLNKLMENEEFTQYYITRYMDLLNTVFFEESMIDILEGIENSIAPEMPQHIDRWGGNFEEWQGNVEKVKNFIRDRIEYFPQGLNECYDLTGPFDVTLDVQPQNAGEITINSLTIDPSLYPWTGQYHGRVDMIIEANSTNNFSYWDLLHHEVPNPEINSLRINLDYNETVTAHYSNNNTPNIVINEINYNSSNEFNTGDWVEIMNPTMNEVDISGWILKDDNDEHIFTIPENTMIESNGYFVFCNDLSSFTELFQNVENVAGEFNFGFSANGDAVRLYNFDNIIIDIVEYGDSFPWPEEPDGEGATLELIDINSDNSMPESWAASYLYCNGTPGSLNSVSIQGDIDHDGLVNIVDIILTVNFVLNNQYHEIADLNSDGILNILDVIQLVNIILGSFMAEDATTANIHRTGNEIHLKANGFIGAIQITLVHEPDFQIELTDNALVSEYKSETNSTTIIIVKPEEEFLFSSQFDFVIDEVVVANSNQIIPVNVPTNFSLDRVYPNPFNAVTKIDFSIPHETKVEIIIYDILGQQILSLVNTRMIPGNHTITWHAEDIASGIYFVKLSADQYNKIQKVMLLK